MANVMIFVPAYGNNVSSHTLMSIAQLQVALMTRGLGVGVSALSRPDIEELRNIALSVWYDQYPDWTHLLMVDSDMGFPSEMVLDMVAFGQPVVGAVYRHKSDNVSWVYSGLGKDTIGDVRGPFVELEGVGAGVLLITRGAIDEMIRKLPEIVDERMARMGGGVDADKQMMGQKRLIRAFDKIKDPEFGTVSEDLSFCRRWRQCGGKVWGAAGYDVQHVGMKVYEGNFKEWTIEQNRIVTPAPEPGPVDDLPSSSNDLFAVVKAKHGTFKVMTRDTFIGRSMMEYGEWCEFELDLLLPLIPLGGYVIDVGANIGTHAVPFAKKVGLEGRVLAYEPQPPLMELLLEQIQTNTLADILEPVPAAVGNYSGSLTVPVFPSALTRTNFGAIPLITGSSGPDDMRRICAMVRLDSLTPRRLDLIKIDVEGMEAEVIDGGHKLITKHKPLLYVECNGDDCSALAVALKGIGYQARWHIGPYFNPNNYFYNAANCWPTVMPSVNMICYPIGDPREAQFSHLEQFLDAGDNWRKASRSINALRDHQASILTG